MSTYKNDCPRNCLRISWLRASHDLHGMQYMAASHRYFSGENRIFFLMLTLMKSHKDTLTCMFFDWICPTCIYIATWYALIVCVTENVVTNSIARKVGSLVSTFCVSVLCLDYHIDLVYRKKSNWEFGVELNPSHVFTRILRFAAGLSTVLVEALFPMIYGIK